MPKDNNETAAITPEESLDSLPKLAFEPRREEQESDLRRAELLQSALLIAGVDHVAESKLVLEVVKNALGQVPAIGE
jgi:hypothetical protein